MRVPSLFVLVLLLSLASAQTLSGGLEGRVSDPSGAVLVGAEVRALHVESGVAATRATDAQGRYRFERLEPGSYEVTFSAPGFLPQSFRVGVKLGQVLNVSATLRVGGEQRAISVSEYGAALDTSTSTVQTLITQEEILELPLPQRSFTDLLVLVPGLRPQGAFARNKGRAGTVSMNGSDGRNSDVSLDGVDNRDYISGGHLQSLPLSAVREYRVSTANAAPDEGRTNGALIDVLSRSGAQRSHGQAFLYVRTDELGARNWFERRDGAPDPPASRWNFGGSLGGAIAPRLFFWAGAELLRDRDSNFVTEAALAELGLIPGAQPQRFLARPFDDGTASLRLDWARSDADHLFLRAATQYNVSRNDLMGEPAASDISNGNRTSNRFASAVTAWTHTFSPNALNELRLAFLDARSEIEANSREPNLSFAAVSMPGVPDTPAVQVGANQSTPGMFYQSRWQVRDDISLARGRHQWNFGAGHIYQPRLGGLYAFGAVGHIVTFFDRPSVIAGRPDLYPQGFATPGAVQTLQYSNGDASFAQSTNLFSAHVNDRLRVTPRLTVNLGLRYDYAPGFMPDVERDPAFLALRAIGSPYGAGTPRDNPRMFQPRMGIAWNPDGRGRSVLRLGYGLFFETLYQQFTLSTLHRFNATIFATPVDLVNTRDGDIGPATAGDFTTFRFGVDALPVAPASSTLLPGSQVRMLHPQFTNPYAQDWTAAYEHKLADFWTASVTFTHVLSVKEHMAVEANPRPEGGGPRILADDFAAAGVTPLGSIRMFESANRSRYDALTFAVRRSFHRNVYWQASYVLSRAATWGGRYASSYNFGRPRVSEANKFAAGEHGPSSADERHRFVASALFLLPGGFEIAPILQAASARPYTVFAGQDLNGDGVFGGSGEEGIFGDRLIVDGGQLPVNTQRGDPFFQADLRVSKGWTIADRARFHLVADFFNLFNTANFGNNYFSIGEEALRNPQPRGLFGKQGEVGSTVGVPFASQVGLRLTF